MGRQIYSFVLLFVFIVHSSFGSEIIKIKESFISDWDNSLDVDSLAIWKKTDLDHPWLFATAKRGHSIQIYDSATGKKLKSFGKRGRELGEFDRPNGITVGGNFLFVVERDNHRVQVFSLPTLSPLISFGEDDLLVPYGITLVTHSESDFSVYVTDNRISKDEDEKNQVYLYRLKVIDHEPQVQIERVFGNKEGPGVLGKVESIFADTDFNQLLIADEDSKDIKVYQLDGQFTGKIIGNGLFQGDPEGIALYRCGQSAGYWIATDQNPDPNSNHFYVFKRESFEYLGGFFGDATSNTDGIVLTQSSYEKFPHGGLFVVNNDGGVNAFNLDTIYSNLNLSRFLPSYCAQ